MSEFKVRPIDRAEALRRADMLLPEPRVADIHAVAAAIEQAVRETAEECARLNDALGYGVTAYRIRAGFGILPAGGAGTQAANIPFVLQCARPAVAPRPAQDDDSETERLLDLREGS